MKHQRDPSVAGLENGGFVVTWTSTERANGLSGIYGQRYDAAGNAAGGEFRVSSATARVHSRSSLTALAGGGFAVTWISEGVDGSRTGVFAPAITRAGRLRAANSRSMNGRWTPNQHCRSPDSTTTASSSPGNRTAAIILAGKSSADITAAQGSRRRSFVQTQWF